jgi:hypothetical protein
METSQLLINLLLFLFLPLWGVAGFIDWCCHRATNIETTSGLRESLMHSVMGIQVGIPILMCLLYRVNVLVLLICLAAWILHEVVAHADVRYALPLRKISIWEMHAHSYLATLPLYMMALIMIINWPVTVDLFTLNWAGQLQLVSMEYRHGGNAYLPFYLTFMAALCVFPYLEENIRCLRQVIIERSPSV